MKYFSILVILLLGSVLSFQSCKDNADAGASRDVSAAPAPPPVATPNTPTFQPPPQAAGAGVVWHYTCSKGCAGGADAAGNCATCGSPLAHNAAYHANANNTPTATPITPTTTTPTAVDPAQNANGVWHYTCAKGCAGGAGAAGVCGTCGGALAHNPAYHQ